MSPKPPTPRDTLLQAVIDLTRLQRTRRRPKRGRSKTAAKPSARLAQRE